MEFVADLEQTSTAFLAVLRARARASGGKAVAWINTTIREVLRPAPIAVGLLCDAFRSREEVRPIFAFPIVNVNTKEVVHVGGDTGADRAVDGAATA